MFQRLSSFQQALLGGCAVVFSTALIMLRPNPLSFLAVLIGGLGGLLLFLQGVAG